MARLACIGIAFMLLLLVPQPAASEGPRAKEFWDRNLKFTANYTGPPGTDIEVAAGVNITFAPPGYPYGEGEERVYFVLTGGLKVCGTENNTASFYAKNYVWFYYGESPACITVMGNGLPGQLDVRNCTFSSVVLDLNGTAGVVQDCTFVNCGVFVQNSACVFRNCTFLTSTLTLISVNSVIETGVLNCSFDGAALLPEEMAMHYMPFNGIAVYGYASISGCDVTRYYYGIASWAGLPMIRDTSAHGCHYGIAIYTEDPADTPVVSNCTMYDCTMTGLSAAGNVLISNCTSSGSETGMEFYNFWKDGSPVWTLRGNGVYGNAGYGISFTRGECDTGDTRFDDGAGSGNGHGRVQGLESIIYNVISPDGEYITNCWLNFTSATGKRTDRYNQRDGAGQLDVQVFDVDNSGARKEMYPYTVRAEKNGRVNQTAMARENRNITLVLDILADILPAGIAIEPRSPKGGQYTAFTLTVLNNGSQPTTQQGRRPMALFTLDGVRLDEVDIFNILPGNSTKVTALDWRARQGHHTLTVTLDPGNKLPENDESNNNLTYEFDVAAAPPAPVNFPVMQAIGGALLLLMVVGMALWVRQSRRGRPSDGDDEESADGTDEAPEKKDGDKEDDKEDDKKGDKKDDKKLDKDGDSAPAGADGAKAGKI